MDFPGDVLVPLDGSPFGERALPFAIEIVRRAGTRLRLLTVHVPPVPDADAGFAGIAPAVEETVRQAAEDYLAETRERYAAEGLDVSAHVKVGGVDGCIRACAKEHDVGLIAMATHGTGGLRRLWLGSVADRVVRAGDRPVLLVPVHDDDDAPPARGEIRTIIVPLDGSPLAESALAPATAVGEICAAEYLLFRGVPPPHVGSPYLAWTKTDPALHERQRAEAKAYLDRISADLGRAGRRVTEVLSEEADVHDSLVRLADAEEDAIIVMTTHGRGGVRRLILGSVADKVVRGAKGPVLVVPPKR